MLTPLLFALALAIAVLLFRIWVQKRRVDRFVAFSAIGFVLLAAAVFTAVQAMRTACHGDYAVFPNPLACAHP